MKKSNTFLSKASQSVVKQHLGCSALALVLASVVGATSLQAQDLHIDNGGAWAVANIFPGAAHVDSAPAEVAVTTLPTKDDHVHVLGDVTLHNGTKAVAGQITVTETPGGADTNLTFAVVGAKSTLTADQINLANVDSATTTCRILDTTSQAAENYGLGADLKSHTANPTKVVFAAGDGNKAFAINHHGTSANVHAVSVDLVSEEIDVEHAAKHQFNLERGVTALTTQSKNFKGHVNVHGEAELRIVGIVDQANPANSKTSELSAHSVILGAVHPNASATLALNNATLNVTDAVKFVAGNGQKTVVLGEGATLALHQAATGNAPVDLTLENNAALVFGSAPALDTANKLTAKNAPTAAGQLTSSLSDKAVAPRIVFGAGNNAVVFNHTGTSETPFELKSDLVSASGAKGNLAFYAGYTKLSGKAEELSAAATVYKDATAELNGVQSGVDVVVQQGGTFAGTATVNSLKSSGTTAPGTAKDFGTITVNSTPTLDMNHILRIKVSPNAVEAAATTPAATTADATTPAAATPATISISDSLIVATARGSSVKNALKLGGTLKLVPTAGKKTAAQNSVAFKRKTDYTFHVAKAAQITGEIATTQIEAPAAYTVQQKIVETADAQKALAVTMTRTGSAALTETLAPKADTIAAQVWKVLEKNQNANDVVANFVDAVTSLDDADEIAAALEAVVSPALGNAIKDTTAQTALNSTSEIITLLQNGPQQANNVSASFNQLLSSTAGSTEGKLNALASLAPAAAFGETATAGVATSAENFNVKVGKSSVWMNISGSRVKSRDSEENGWDGSKTTGYAPTFGVHYDVSKTLRLGAFGGYKYADIRLLDESATARDRSFNGGVHATFKPVRQTSIDAVLSYAYHNKRGIQSLDILEDLETEGSEATELFSGDLEKKSQAHVYTGALQVGHAVCFGNGFSATPYANVGLAYRIDPSHTEGDTDGISVEVADETSKYLQGRVGVQLQHVTACENAEYSTFLNLGYVHNRRLGGEDEATDVMLFDEAISLDKGRNKFDTFKVGFGGTALLNNGVYISGSADFDLSGKVRGQAGMIKIGKRI